MTDILPSSLIRVVYIKLVRNSCSCSCAQPIRSLSTPSVEDSLPPTERNWSASWHESFIDRICIQSYYSRKHNVHRLTWQELRGCLVTKESACKQSHTRCVSRCQQTSPESRIAENQKLYTGQIDWAIFGLPHLQDFAIRRLRHDWIHSRCPCLRRPCPWGGSWIQV